MNSDPQECTIGGPVMSVDLGQPLTQQVLEQEIQQLALNPAANQNQTGQQTIWQGILEWWGERIVPSLSPSKQILCKISANSKDSRELKLKTDWPSTLRFQLVSKAFIIDAIGDDYFKNSKSVLLHPERCEVLDSLTKLMSQTGSAGLIHSNPPSRTGDPTLVFLYTPEKDAYHGFIPNDPFAFINRCYEVIKQVGKQTTIWEGKLEWLIKNPSKIGGKQYEQIPSCQVSVNSMIGEQDLNAAAWSSKLRLELLSKEVIDDIDVAYFDNSEKVFFHPTPCEVLDSLTERMSTGNACFVHLISPGPVPKCNKFWLILTYSPEAHAYLGTIPNDQKGFMACLRKVMKAQSSLEMESAGPKRV